MEDDNATDSAMKNTRQRAESQRKRNDADISQSLSHQTVGKDTLTQKIRTTIAC